MTINKEKYKNFQKQLADVKEQSKKLFRDAFNEMSKELFEENPRLLAFKWNQYTPYFNDGDACYFSVHSDEPGLTVLSETGEEVETDICEIPYYPENELEGLQKELGEKVAEFIQEFSQEDLETAFEEGTISVNRDGTIDTEECSHD